MKKFSRNLLDILIRYLILIFVAFPNLWIFYFVFTPLTIYPVYFLLSLFSQVSLINNVILFDGDIVIELISACIAGSAYYFLLILNLSVPRINTKKRLQIILFSFSFLLLLNILRIFLLSLLLYYDLTFFYVAHKIFWYLGSTLFVVGIWFVEVKLFKIKEIPFYSDIKFLYKKSILRKKVN